MTESPERALAVEAPHSRGLFARLSLHMIRWAQHRHAERYLAGVAFAESSFFPLPPDTMLIPMTIAQPSRAIRFATITTVASVIGGLYGYAIGHFAADTLQSLMNWLGYQNAYVRVLQWFDQWGVAVVLIAGFSPIPYKLFTIGAGSLGLGIVPFAIASAVGRGTRFYLEALLIAKMGSRLAPTIIRHIERIGWLMAALLGLFVVYAVLQLC